MTILMPGAVDDLADFARLRVLPHCHKLLRAKASFVGCPRREEAMVPHLWNLFVSDSHHIIWTNPEPYQSVQVCSSVSVDRQWPHWFQHVSTMTMMHLVGQSTRHDKFFENLQWHPSFEVCPGGIFWCFCLRLVGYPRQAQLWKLPSPDPENCSEPMFRGTLVYIRNSWQGRFASLRFDLQWQLNRQIMDSLDVDFILCFLTFVCLCLGILDWQSTETVWNWPASSRHLCTQATREASAAADADLADLTAEEKRLLER